MKGLRDSCPVTLLSLFYLFLPCSRQLGTQRKSPCAVIGSLCQRSHRAKSLLCKTRPWGIDKISEPWFLLVFIFEQSWEFWECANVFIKWKLSHLTRLCWCDSCCFRTNCFVLSTEAQRCSRESQCTKAFNTTEFFIQLIFSAFFSFVLCGKYC